MHPIKIQLGTLMMKCLCCSCNKMLCVVFSGSFAFVLCSSPSSSSQFVEIKGSVFKKFEKNNLFQMSNSGKIFNFLTALLIHNLKKKKTFMNQVLYKPLLLLLSLQNGKRWIYWEDLSMMISFCTGQYFKHPVVITVWHLAAHFLLTSYSEFLLTSATSESIMWMTHKLFLDRCMIDIYLTFLCEMFIS